MFSNGKKVVILTVDARFNYSVTRQDSRPYSQTFHTRNHCSQFYNIQTEIFK